MKVKGSYDPNRGMARYQELPVPLFCNITATGPDLPCDVDMEAALEDGRMVVRSMTLTARRGTPIMAEALRRIPVATILHEGVVSAVGSLSGLAGVDPATVGRRGPTPDVLRMVASVYRMAYLLGYPPTASVAKTFQVPRSTAGRWVQLARREGSLGPADERTAGEAALTRISRQNRARSPKRSKQKLG